MAKTKTLDDIRQQEMDLVKQLEAIRAERLDLARKEAENTKKQIAVELEELAAKISELRDENLWTWGPEHEQALDSMGLVTDEPKAKAVDEDFAKKVIELLTGKSGMTVDDLKTSLGISLPTVRQKMPAIVARGDVKSKPNPANQRQNLYFIE